MYMYFRWCQIEIPANRPILDEFYIRCAKEQLQIVTETAAEFFRRAQHKRGCGRASKISYNFVQLAHHLAKLRLRGRLSCTRAALRGLGGADGITHRTVLRRWRWGELRIEGETTLFRKDLPLVLAAGLAVIWRLCRRTHHLERELTDAHTGVERHGHAVQVADLERDRPTEPRINEPGGGVDDDPETT